MRTTFNPKSPVGIIEFIGLMAAMTSIAALGIDAMLPVLAQIGKDIGVINIQSTHLIISLFFIGLTFGQFVFGVVADIHGRRFTTIMGLAIFMVGTVICYISNNLTVMIIGRIIQAFGISGPRIAALAILRDKYEGNEMARIMSFMTMIFIAVPMIAPAVGQLIVKLGHWRDIFLFFMIYAAILGIWFYRRQEETLAKINPKAFSVKSLFASIILITRHPVVLSYTLASGILFGSFIAYISASQTVFQFIYDTGDLFPLYFATLAFFMGLSSYINAKIVRRFGLYKISHAALSGFLFFSMILLVESWFFNGLPPLIVTFLTLIGAFFSIGFLFGNLTAIAMIPLGNAAGLGAAVINSLSGIMSIPIAVFIGHFIESSMTPIAIGFSICSATSLLVIYLGKRFEIPPDIV